MATDAADFAYHGTLTANAIDEITIKANTADTLEVYNKGTSGIIYFTVDGSDPVIPNPSGKNIFFAAPLSAAYAPAEGSPDTVKLICGTANAYAITGTP